MLRVPCSEVLQPEDLAQALVALEAASTPAILAGGTDLLVSLKYGHSAGPSLLSLSRLPLAGIAREADGWAIGAGTTLAELARWAPAGALGALSRAATLVAAPPIQSRATLGGNLCLDTRCAFYNQSAFWRSGRPACHKAGGGTCHAVPRSARCHACHQADLPPLGIALGARAVIASRAGERTIDLDELYSGDAKLPLRLERSELVTRLLLSEPPPGSGAAYEKLRARKGLDFPAAAAAVYLEVAEDGSCCRARVVLGAMDSRPLRVPAAEEALTGSHLQPAVLEQVAAAARQAARPVRNADLTPAYRKKVIGTLAVRAARAAWSQATGGRN